MTYRRSSAWLLIPIPFASCCAAEGTLQYRLGMGHADFSTTMDIYTHITQENMQEKAKNISVNMKLM